MEKKLSINFWQRNISRNFEISTKCGILCTEFVCDFSGGTNWKKRKRERKTPLRAENSVSGKHLQQGGYKNALELFYSYFSTNFYTINIYTCKNNGIGTWTTPHFNKMNNVTKSQGRMTSKHNTRCLECTTKTICRIINNTIYKCTQKFRAKI